MAGCNCPIRITKFDFQYISVKSVKSILCIFVQIFTKHWNKHTHITEYPTLTIRKSLKSIYQLLPENYTLLLITVSQSAPSQRLRPLGLTLLFPPRADTLGRFAPTSPLPLLGIGFANTCAASATSLIPTKCMKFVPRRQVGELILYVLSILLLILPRSLNTGLLYAPS